MAASRLVLVASLCLLSGGIAAGAETSALFEKSVRPLLERKCFDCHSARAEDVKGNLKLDSLESIFAGGDNGPAIVAGDVENSFLLRAIRYQVEDYQMPPAGRLDDEEIAAVEAWVKSLEEAAQRKAAGR
jgi:mono/diheme cytochrome c family protein